MAERVSGHQPEPLRSGDHPPVRPLTEGYVNKGGHNDFPSQVTERPPAPQPSVLRQQTQFVSIWAFGDRVHLDGDTSIKGTVTGFAFRVTRDPTVEVSYFHNGESKTAWFEEFRLSKVPK